MTRNLLADIIFVTGLGACMTSLVIAQGPPGGGVPTCYRLVTDGVCGACSEQDPRELVYCGNYFPEWVIHPAIIWKCDIAVGSGQMICDENVLDKARPTITYYACGGPGQCYPVAINSPIEISPFCPSAALGGTGCP